MSGWERLGWTSEGYMPTWVYAATLGVMTLVLVAILALADTHPKDGDATEIAAPLVSGAVGSEAGETPKTPLPNSHPGDTNAK